jgi:hypothetical protein
VLACQGEIGKMPLNPPPLPPQAYSKRRVPMTDSSSVVPPTEMTFGSDAGYSAGDEPVNPGYRAMREALR